MICNWQYANWNRGQKCNIEKDITLNDMTLTDNVLGEDSIPETSCKFTLNTPQKMDNIKQITKFWYLANYSIPPHTTVVCFFYLIGKMIQ